MENQNQLSNDVLTEILSFLPQILSYRGINRFLNKYVTTTTTHLLVKNVRYFKHVIKPFKNLEMIQFRPSLEKAFERIQQTITFNLDFFRGIKLLDLTAFTFTKNELNGLKKFSVPFSHCGRRYCLFEFGKNELLTTEKDFLFIFYSAMWSNDKDLICEAVKNVDEKKLNWGRIYEIYSIKRQQNSLLKDFFICCPFLKKFLCEEYKKVFFTDFIDIEGLGLNGYDVLDLKKDLDFKELLFKTIENFSSIGLENLKTIGIDAFIDLNIPEMDEKMINLIEKNSSFFLTFIETGYDPIRILHHPNMKPFMILILKMNSKCDIVRHLMTKGFNISLIKNEFNDHLIQLFNNDRIDSLIKYEYVLKEPLQNFFDIQQVLNFPFSKIKSVEFPDLIHFIDKTGIFEESYKQKKNWVWDFFYKYLMHHPYDTKRTDLPLLKGINLNCDEFDEIFLKISLKSITVFKELIENSDYQIDRILKTEGFDTFILKQVLIQSATIKDLEYFMNLGYDYNRLKSHEVLPFRLELLDSKVIQWILDFEHVGKGDEFSVEDIQLFHQQELEKLSLIDKEEELNLDDSDVEFELEFDEDFDDE
eukprot:gene9676-1882_t